MAQLARLSLCPVLFILLLISAPALSQSVSPCATQTPITDGPRICKVDPPNWWSPMPAPMLLVYGEGLSGVRWHISDPAVHLRTVATSANGHYAQLWLGTTPTHPETVRLLATSGRATAEISYTFRPRRAPGDGFAGFSSRDTMYLIMTDRFADGDPGNDGADHAAQRGNPHGWHGGDLRGILDHLDYLQQLGITTLWITPVDENHEPDSYHGYGATDLYRVDDHFGTLDDLQKLAAALHARHMKLVLDLVPNHIGPLHPWVADSPDPTWFHGTRSSHTLAQGEFEPVTNPHAPWRDQQNVTQGWFANILPDMNQEDPAVKQYLIQNAVWWVEQAGVDGLRLDTFPYIARPFWHDFHAQLHTLYPHLTTVGEVFNGDPTVTSTFAGGVTRTGVDTGLDTPFDFPSHFALLNVFLKDHPMTELAGILRLDNLFPHPERLVPFLGNHDTSRFMNDPQATPARLQMANAVLTTMRGMPEIYSGDEIAMRGGDDPDNRRDFPGGFAGDAHNAFSEAGRTPEEQSAFTSLQQLLSIRRAHPALQTGSMQVLAASQDVLVYARVLNGAEAPERILVAVNKGRVAQNIVVPIEATALAGSTGATPLLGSESGAPAVTVSAQQLTLRLSPETAVIEQMQ